MKVSKVKLKKKLEQVNKVCNIDFMMEQYRHGWYRAVSENSDVYSPFLDLEGLWQWLDAFTQGWIELSIYYRATTSFLLLEKM